MQDTICIELLRWLWMPFRFNKAVWKPSMNALLNSILNTIFTNKYSRHNTFEIDQHEKERCVRAKGNPKSTSHVVIIICDVTCISLQIPHRRFILLFRVKHVAYFMQILQKYQIRVIKFIGFIQSSNYFVTSTVLFYDYFLQFIP